MRLRITIKKPSSNPKWKPAIVKLIPGGSPKQKRWLNT